MKKIFILLFLVTAVGIKTYSQDYKTSAGLRLGQNSGISVKGFIKDYTAIEGIFKWQLFHVDMTVLLENHIQAFDVERLYFYYGGGMHIGNPDGESTYHEENNLPVIGLDGIVGLEYSFKNAPFNISMDCKPSLNLWTHSGFNMDMTAVSIRYIF